MTARNLEGLLAEQPQVIEVQLAHSRGEVLLKAPVGQFARGPPTVQQEICPHVGA